MVTFSSLHVKYTRPLSEMFTERVLGWAEEPHAGLVAYLLLDKRSDAYYSAWQ